MLIQQLPRLLSGPVNEAVMIRQRQVPGLLPAMLRSCLFHLARINSLAAAHTQHRTLAVSAVVSRQSFTSREFSSAYTGPKPWAVLTATKKEFSSSSRVCTTKKPVSKKTVTAADDTLCHVFDQNDLLVGHMTVKQAEESAKKDNLKLHDMGVNADRVRCFKLVTGQDLAQESKRQRLAKKADKEKQMKEKEFRIVSNIDEHDLATKLRHARDVVGCGGRAKFVIRAHRRSQQADKDLAQVSKTIRKDMEDCAVIKEGHKTPTEQMLLLVPLPTAGAQ